MERKKIIREAFCKNLKEVSPMFGIQDMSEIELHDFNDFGFAVTNELTINAYEFAKEYMPEKYWHLFHDIDFVYELKSENTWSYGALRFLEAFESDNKYFFTGIEYLYRLGYGSIREIGDELLGENTNTASYKDFINEINEFNNSFRDARHEFKSFIDKNFYKIFKFEI